MENLMFVKILGSLLLVCAGLVLALSICRYHRHRLDTLDGFVSLIYFIKGQVDCYARPVSEILEALPPEILLDCNCPEGASSLEELVSESKIYLDRDTLHYLTAFASEFGSTFREEQTRRCDHYIALLRDRRGLVSEGLLAEMRSKSALCICVSLCLAILLW